MAFQQRIAQGSGLQQLVLLLTQSLLSGGDLLAALFEFAAGLLQDALLSIEGGVCRVALLAGLLQGDLQLADPALQIFNHVVVGQYRVRMPGGGCQLARQRLVVA